MFLLVFVLNKTEKLNEILQRFLEIGIKGATVLDSKGMGETFLECDDFIIGGLRKMIYNDCRATNKTVFSVVNSKESAENAIREIEAIAGSLEEPGTGIAFTINLESVKGMITAQKGA